MTRIHLLRPHTRPDCLYARLPDQAASWSAATASKIIRPPQANASRGRFRSGCADHVIDGISIEFPFPSLPAVLAGRSKPDTLPLVSEQTAAIRHLYSRSSTLALASPPASLSPASSLRFGVRSEESGVACFIECTGRQFHNGLSRGLFCCVEATSVQLHK